MIGRVVYVPRTRVSGEAKLFDLEAAWSLEAMYFEVGDWDFGTCCHTCYYWNIDHHGSPFMCCLLLERMLAWLSFFLVFFPLVATAQLDTCVSWPRLFGLPEYSKDECLLTQCSLLLRFNIFLHYSDDFCVRN
jgi:hypothetical protein